MGKVLAGISISLDGYITGPNDGPGAGLGEGGERLHYWVFGGPWRYDAERVGFVREGRKRKAYLKDGEWVDSVLYALLAEDLA